MSAELHYKNDDFEVELDGNFYRADIDATAEYSYSAGRMYMPTDWLYDNPDVFPPPEPDWY